MNTKTRKNSSTCFQNKTVNTTNINSTPSPTNNMRKRKLREDVNVFTLKKQPKEKKIKKEKPERKYNKW